MKFDILKDWLPVGSVISIRFSTEKFMITGYLPIDSESKQIYDYNIVQLPNGLEGKDKMIFVNKDFIKKIHFFGYINEEYNKLLIAIEKTNQKNKKEEQNG